MKGRRRSATIIILLGKQRLGLAVAAVNIELLVKLHHALVVGGQSYDHGHVLLL